MTEMRGSHVDIYNHDENAATYARDVLRSDDPIREGYTEVLDWSAQIARAVENGLMTTWKRNTSAMPSSGLKVEQSYAAK